MLSGLSETKNMDHLAQCAIWNQPYKCEFPREVRKGLQFVLTNALHLPFSQTSSLISSQNSDHSSDLPNLLPLSLVAADCWMGWEQPWQSRSFSYVTPLFSLESLILTTVGRRSHAVAFAEAHLASTVTQHRVDTQIHNNHQAGAFGGLSSQHFSPHWILHESHDQRSRMSST